MKNGTTDRIGTANTLQGFMKNNFQFQNYFERVDSLSITNRSMILMKLLNQNNIKKKVSDKFNSGSGVRSKQHFQINGRGLDG